MKCARCHHNINGKDKYCSSCGYNNFQILNTNANKGVNNNSYQRTIAINGSKILSVLIIFFVIFIIMLGAIFSFNYSVISSQNNEVFNYDNLDVFSGTYKQQNIVIRICRMDYTTSQLSITKKNKTMVFKTILSSNEEMTMVGDGIDGKVKIIKIDNGIMLDTDSSSYEELSGIYFLEMFSKESWNGFYKNSNIGIALSELSSVEVRAYIKKGNSTIQELSLINKKNGSLEYIGVEGIITITKNNDLINIVTFPNSKANFLNGINRSYERKGY